MRVSVLWGSPRPRRSGRRGCRPSRSRPRRLLTCGVRPFGVEEVQKAADSFHLDTIRTRSEEHTSELQSLAYLVCRLLLEKKKRVNNTVPHPTSHPHEHSR